LGFDLALDKKPDFIILDINLPDIDDTEVLKMIRATDIGSSVYVIIMTSFAMTGDREKYCAAGCDGYIEKPIDPHTVINQIRQVIGE
jgi:CheY-like chemotaxis protein